MPFLTQNYINNMSDDDLADRILKRLGQTYMAQDQATRALMIEAEVALRAQKRADRFAERISVPDDAEVERIRSEVQVWAEDRPDFLTWDFAGSVESDSEIIIQFLQWLDALLRKLKIESTLAMEHCKRADRFAERITELEAKNDNWKVVVRDLKDQIIELETENAAAANTCEELVAENETHRAAGVLSVARITELEAQKDAAFKIDE